jgi:hypothetical protein
LFAGETYWAPRRWVERSYLATRAYRFPRT